MSKCQQSSIQFFNQTFIYHNYMQFLYSYLFLSIKKKSFY